MCSWRYASGTTTRPVPCPPGALDVVKWPVVVSVGGLARRRKFSVPPVTGVKFGKCEEPKIFTVASADTVVIYWEFEEVSETRTFSVLLLLYLHSLFLTYTNI